MLLQKIIVKLFSRLIIFGVLLIPTSTFAQGACPACSNPTLPSAINDHFYSDTIKRGINNTAFYSVNGFNFKGGHLNGGYLGGGGVSPDGKKINVPLHTHDVSMNFYRAELASSYAFKDNWTIRMYLPFEIREQKATTTFLDSIQYSQYEKDAIINNRDLHHRTETYSGIADMKLLISYRFFKVFSKKDQFDFSFGSSIPVGKTEPNVLKLIAQNKKHLHIQFGTGTIDPLLDINYSASLSKKIAFNIYALGRISLYENNKEYKGPLEITSGLNIFYFKRKFNFRAGVISLYQGYYYWDGVRDRNSGLFSTMMSTGLQTKISKHIFLNTGIRYPLYQTTFINNEEGPYKQGPTIMMELNYWIKY